MTEGGRGLAAAAAFARDQYARGFRRTGGYLPPLPETLFALAQKNGGRLNLSGSTDEEQESVLRAFVEGWQRRPPIAPERLRAAA